MNCRLLVRLRVRAWLDRLTFLLIKIEGVLDRVVYVGYDAFHALSSLEFDCVLLPSLIVIDRPHRSAFDWATHCSAVSGLQRH